MGRAYGVIRGQCTQQMSAKVKLITCYNAIHAASDLLGLLNLIKLTTFAFHTNPNLYLAIIEVEKPFQNFRQLCTMSCKEYHKKNPELK